MMQQKTSVSFVNGRRADFHELSWQITRTQHV